MTKLWRPENGPPEGVKGWVCFQCGTICETEGEAERHFGTYSEARKPRCFAWGEAWEAAWECVRLAVADIERGSTDVARERLQKALARLNVSL